MSYTQFTSTATCQVVEGFNLDSFLDALHQRCINEDNFIAQNYGLDLEEEHEICDLDFHNYVTLSGQDLTINLDTEETCYGDSEVYDWLVEQFIPVMTSRYLKVEGITMDSYCHYGYTAFHDKNGNVLTVDDLLAHYEATQTD